MKISMFFLLKTGTEGLPCVWVFVGDFMQAVAASGRVI